MPERIENALDEHRSMIGALGHPKPNEVRDAIAPGKGAGLKKKAKALLEAVKAVPWRLDADVKPYSSYRPKGRTVGIEVFEPS